MREIAEECAQRQRAAVEKWLEPRPIPLLPARKVFFVDSIRERFKGHETDAFARNKNEKRWINEFLETEGKTGDGATPSPTHPGT